MPHDYHMSAYTHQTTAAILLVNVLDNALLREKKKIAEIVIIMQGLFYKGGISLPIFVARLHKTLCSNNSIFSLKAKNVSSG